MPEAKLTEYQLNGQAADNFQQVLVFLLFFIHDFFLPWPKYF